MPEIDHNDEPADAAPAQAVQPLTEAQLHEKRMAALPHEGDKARAERRARELDTETTIHFANVAEAHEMYPAPLSRNWGDFTPEQQRLWNDRRKTLDSANVAYNRAVRRVMEAHWAEDRHLARLAAKAQENA